MPIIPDPTDALSAVVQLAQLVYHQVEMAKANKKLCARLGDQVRIVHHALSGMADLPRTQQFMDGLNDLNQLLQQCIIFISQFSRERKWSGVVKFMKAGTYQATYHELNVSLQARAQFLNLGFAAQHLVNQEADKEALQADMAALKQQNAEIRQLILGEHKSRQSTLDSQEKRHVDTLQADSIQAELTSIIAQKKPQAPLIDPKLSVSFYELAIDALLSEGSFGRVYAGTWSHEPVAIKMLESASSLSEQDRAEFVREVKIMARLRHPCIVSFYGACMEKDRACLVMEKLERGSLYAVLGTGEVLSTRQRLQLALDIAKGLDYLHQRDVLHRDLKSANILVGTDWHAKITDFGLSKISSLSVRTAKDKSQAWQWLAPELMKAHGKYVAASELYSYGMLVWEIFTGARPYAKERVTPQDILRGKRETIPASVPKPIAGLIERCWSKEPSQRPTLDAIIDGLHQQIRQLQAGDTLVDLESEAVKANDAKDYARAYQLWSDAAQLGSLSATSWCGFFHLTGRGGVAVNKGRAFTLLKQAAEGGEGRAQYNLARMFEKGDGVTQNAGEALRWYQAAKKNQYDVAACEQKITQLAGQLKTVGYRG